MSKITRRQFILGSATAAAVGVYAPQVLAARPARQKIREVYSGKRGTTITMELDAAPFPAKGARYKDNTVVVFVPHYYRIRSDYRVDCIMHFHGYRDTAIDAMRRHQLREQLYDSKQNAIIIFPQGPVRAQDPNFGKLDQPRGFLRLLTEVRETLQTPSLQARLGRSGIPNRARIGKCILSAHSGGFRVVANCLEHGGFNVNEVYLFDALYGRAETFSSWIAETYHRRGPMAERHKLISFYSGPATTRENRRLMGFLKRHGIDYQHEEVEGTELSKRDMTTSRAVFVRTQSRHDRVLFSTNAMRDCLFASCLTRFLKTDWFKDADQPRLR